MTFSPIGFFHSSKKYPYDAARQPQHDVEQAVGEIELEPDQNFEQALSGLESFSHIWLIFIFHQKQNWKPMVQPPRGSPGKQGVFATRSPHRPNPIGMSVVRLLKIEGRKIWVSGHDLLNETPILDIKPYVPTADLVPEANSGWIQSEDLLAVQFSKRAQEQLLFLSENQVPELKGFLQRQLESAPLDSSKKRVKPNGNHGEIAYRTWRADYRVQEPDVEVLQIRSGYSEQEIKEPANASSSFDPYQDKAIHREFIRRWSQSVVQSED